MVKTYQVDPAHSSITFTVKHMMISKVKGKFKQFDIDVDGDPNDVKNAYVKVTIQAATVDTNNKERDNHLRSGDFFNADVHPHIVFESTSFRPKVGDKFELTGSLTIRGTTRKETFEVKYEGNANYPAGKLRHAFSGCGSLNREDYSLTWNQALEAGGVVVDKKVKFEFKVQFIELKA